MGTAGACEQVASDGRALFLDALKAESRLHLPLLPLYKSLSPGIYRVFLALFLVC